MSLSLSAIFAPFQTSFASYCVWIWFYLGGICGRPDLFSERSRAAADEISHDLLIHTLYTSHSSAFLTLNAFKSSLPTLILPPIKASFSSLLNLCPASFHSFIISKSKLTGDFCHKSKYIQSKDIRGSLSSLYVLYFGSSHACHVLVLP